MKKLTATAAIIATLFLSSCFDKPENTMPYEKYREQGELMINITYKLSRETDANRLNSAARGVQLSRVVSCHKLYDECDLYGKFLSEAIEMSADGKLSYDDVQSLTSMQRDLVNEVKRGYASYEKK